VPAVVLQWPDYAPNVGEARTSGGQVFRFSALPERFFPQTGVDKTLMLQSGRFCPMAKPEVAVLHWLRLARSPRSSMRMPPQEVDFTLLDLKLLNELAWRWELAGPLEAWMEEVQKTRDILETSEPRARQVATEDGRSPSGSGEAARQRLPARRLAGKT